MTPHEAAARLVFHSQPEPGSFLDMLRPFKACGSNGLPTRPL